MSKGVGIGSVYMLDLVTDSIKEYDPDDRSTIGKPIGYLLLMTFIYLLGYLYNFYKIVLLLILNLKMLIISL